ncbi:hypothetical protein FRB97_008243 [Tulasnella sp. 331]|nr:hypothetical protein FRB97_008243 [Tulasnella sp. 331]
MLAVAPKGIPKAYFAHGNATTACQIIQDPVEARFKFCEDVKMLPDDNGAGGQLLLSCDPGRLQWNPVLGFMTDPTPRGDLWIYSYGVDGQSELRKITLVGFPSTATFHSLGVDTFPDPSGGLRIFATNLGAEKATVELFHLADPRAAEPVATHIATVWHPGFMSPNAIAAVSPTSFYVTQDHRWPARMFGPHLSLFETVTKIPGGIVALVVFDEANGRVTKITNQASVSFANGISISPDGKTVAVASSTESNVYLYERDMTTNVLRYRTRVHVPQHADNLDYAGDGTLYVAGHPYLLSLLEVAKGTPEAVSPSWVTSITAATEAQFLDAGANSLEYQKSWDETFGDAQAPFPHHMRTTIGREHVVKTVYQSDGSVDGGYGGSSSVIVDKKRGFVFISGLYERGLLQCKIEG